MRFLNQLQILPCCSYPIRAHRAVAAREEKKLPPDPIKLIKPDGHVNVYYRPVRVSQLMSEFPKHLVCHSDSFYIGQKIQPLSEHDQLQLGQKYFLLPSHFFQSVLSFVAVASFVSSQPPAAPLSGIAKKAAAQNHLFQVQRTPSGDLRIRVSDEFITQLMEEGRNGAAGSGAPERRDGEEEKEAPPESDGSCGRRNRVCTTAQLERDYEQMVAGPRRRRWKPKLEVIEERGEKKKKKKKKRGSITKFLGIRRGKNSQSHSPRSDGSRTLAPAELRRTDDSRVDSRDSRLHLRCSLFVVLLKGVRRFDYESSKDLIFLGANFMPSIWDVFEFTGATAAVSVGFIFPAAVALRDPHGIAMKKDKVVSWVMILLAVTSSMVAITSEIDSILSSGEGP